jgi:hypothetical protein
MQMFETLGRSWELTKTTFRLIGHDKEMLWFPLLSGIASLIFFAGLVFPWVVLPLMRGGELAGDVMDAMFVFLFYLGSAFIATFFNVCVVNTVKTRLEGGDATFMDSLRFAWSRLPQIAGWSLVSATVGLFLHMLDRMAERAGAVGQILMRILISLMGMAWSVVSLFVVPVMVYDGVGPIDALKRSIETLKETWGEALMGQWGLGLVQFLIMLPCILLCVVSLVVVSPMGGVALGSVLLVWVVVFLGLILVFTVANTVYRTALYHYAATGEVPSGYDAGTLEHAFKPRS